MLSTNFTAHALLTTTRQVYFCTSGGKIAETILTD
ncbi:hypothetical protein MGSAQ_001519 [marine sediment metagenome]|uniref:Uncharacterized protein n=1 Tax=marine sediment metagenome TaxID=412755 RepID=A0A1B6NU45_9ZZZZ